MIPEINKPFTVTFKDHNRIFVARIIHIKPGDDNFRKYTLKTEGGTEFEVDTDWFNTELTGRIITPL